MPAAYKISEEIIAHISAVTETKGKIKHTAVRSNPVYGQYTSKIRKQFNLCSHKNGTGLTSEKTLTNDGFLLSSDTLPITATSFHQKGSLSLQPTEGFFNSTSAGEAINCRTTGATTLTNTLVQAGRTLSFSAGSLSLQLDPAIDFLNRPHRDCAIDPRSTTTAEPVPQHRPS